MEPNPYFSIIIPLFNRIHLIDRAIQSVRIQTFKNWELIIVDDASTDGSWEHIQSINDPQIIKIRNLHNSERCISRNNGILAAKGKYICFLDSDDYHLPEHLEIIYNHIIRRNEPEAFFFTNAWDESDAGIRIPRHCPSFLEFNPYTYLLRYTVNPQRWAVHKNLFKSEKFDPNINIAEDLDTSLRILNKGFPIFQIPVATTVYVASKDSFTHGSINKWERELSNLKKIFSRGVLRNKLPSIETRRLKSMCYFHIATKSVSINEKILFYKFAFLSFILYPKGYNGRTNKILLVNALYLIPLSGKFIKSITRVLK